MSALGFRHFFCLIAVATASTILLSQRVRGEIVTFNMVDVADTFETLEQITVTTGEVIPGGVDLSGGSVDTLSYLGFDIDGDMPIPLPEEDNVENYYDIRVRTGIPSSGGQLVFDGLNHYPVGDYPGSYVVSKGTPSYLNLPFAAGDVIGDGAEEYVRSAPTWHLGVDEGGTVTNYLPGVDNFLGFKLDTGYYGWIRVQYDAALPGTFTLIDGAYENSGAAIVAGDTGLSVGLGGDYNGDEIVDAADYTVWRNNMGGDASAFAVGSRDPLKSGPIDGDDYTYWKSNYGDTTPGSGGIAGLGVPEPSTLLLGLVAGLPFLRRSRTACRS